MKNFLTLVSFFSVAFAMSAQTYNHYHAGQGYGSTSENPWVTNGGTRRTAVTDADGTRDCTLNVMIDNDSTQTEPQRHTKIHDAMQTVQMEDGTHRIAVPIEFDVTGDESIVDHYMLCGFNHENNGSYPIGNKKDPTKGLDDSGWNNTHTYLQEATFNPTNTLVLEVDRTTSGSHHYNCYKYLYDSDGNQVFNDKGLPEYEFVPWYEMSNKEQGVFSVSCYIKVYYKPELNLEPSCHSMVNVSEFVRNIVTAVDDVKVETINDNTIYDLQGRVLNEIPHGMYIQNHKLHIGR